MARGPASGADREVLDYLEFFGYRKKAATLEYWRGQGALPPRRSRGLGRGKGRDSIDPPETKERALWVSRFLDKRSGIPDRPDLPRRRRVAEAPYWLWYEGYPIPDELIRAAVRVYFLGLHERFEVQRQEAADAEPDIEDYEVPVVVADAEVAGALTTNFGRRQLRVFAARRSALGGGDPDGLVLSANSQFVQALQGFGEPERGMLAHLVETPLLETRALRGPLMSQGGEGQLAAEISAKSIVTAVSRLSPEEWREVHGVVRAIRGTVASLSQGSDDQLRDIAKASPATNTVAGLFGVVGGAAVQLGQLRDAVLR